ncbi:MAG: hypothetical protein RQ753_00820 [Desulfurivibrionaceae bacterium]|nr:hypothetical protein [Desulfobulbales bacterium]MDT8334218.1 hypothetical protein [Desulfurivibrionaceae bacterium]
MQDATANRDLTVGAIDLGSNTFRLLIGGFTGDKPSVLLKRNITVGLGQGLSARGRLNGAAIGKGLAALRAFKAELDRYRPDCCRCCGTEALRRADNAGVFLAEAAKILGVGIEVIDGAEEGFLSYRGVLASLVGTAVEFPLLIIDVGAASTELIYGAGDMRPPFSVSLPGGAGLFTELASRGGRQEAFALFTIGLKRFWADCPPESEKISVVATGGTATTMAMLDLGLDHYQPKKIEGHALSGTAIARIYKELHALPIATRKFLPGLEEGRSAIILAGIEIYQEILATIEVDGMIISDSGLLEGIMMSCLEAGLP